MAWVEVVCIVLVWWAFKWFAAINKVVNIIFIKFKRSYRMPKEEQPQTFHFIFILAAVKMKVKFPCKMAIEHAGHPLTKEVPPNEEGKFVFNQEVRLREESEKMFAELNVSLVTEKGARYISGIIKLYHNELIRAEGERLVVTLSKCLDSEAICELKVEKVIREGTQRKRTLTTIPERNQKAANRQNDQANPVVDFKSPQRQDLPIGNSQTKSQAHFPVTNNMRFRKEDSQVRSKEYGGLLGHATSAKRYGNASPKSKARPVGNSKTKYQPFEFNSELERDKLIEAQVYKDNYQKLKHKYLRETENSKNELSRRMMLQNNQNNYKLEIVRLKIRNDQLQKALIEKNARLKEYSNSLGALQGRDSEINFMREDMANKEHSMQIMQETIITLSRQNDQLRAANKDIAFKLQEKIIMLQSQIDTNNARFLAKQHELQRQIKILNETLQFKDTELARKNQTLQKEKRNVYELERALQNKLFQYDSLLQTERANCKQKIQQSKSKIEQITQSMTKIANEKGELISQVDKLKGLLLKGQYEFKLYQQQMNNLRTQLQEIRPVRDRYNEVYKELRIITEQKLSIQKSHQKFMHSKESTLEEMSNQYRKEIEYQKRSIKDLEERNKSLSSKLIEAEGNLQITKGSLDKLRRNHDSLNKDYTQLKQKQKGLKKSLKLKQEECDDIKKEVNRLKQKNQAIFESMKGQMSKVRQDLSKAKIELQSEEIKNEQLNEANSEITMELARLKMTQQFSQEKYEKLMASAQQKYSQFQKIIKEHQGVIQLLEEKIRAQKGNEKEFYTKLQKSDYEVNLVAQRNDKVVKELRTFEQRNKQLQSNLKNKQNQLGQALKNITQLQFQLNDSHEKTSQLKEQLQLTKNQLEKGKKMIQILQRDLDKSKSQVLLYSQRLTDRQRQLQDKLQQLRRDKETISSLESKSATVRKQYDRFKESVHEALNSSFTQIIHTFQKQDASRISTIPSIQFSHGSSNPKRPLGLADLSNDLVTMISMAGKENKGQITKLTERTRQLERDLELMRSQSDRSVQSSKRQLQQRSNYIEQLQDELRSIKNDKGESEVHYQMQVAELEDHIKQYQNQCQSLINHKNELQFSLSSFKVQAEKMADQFQKKIGQLKRQRIQYQQKLQYQYHSTEIVQKKVHEIEVQLMNVNSVLMLEKQALYKKELKVQELQDERQRLTKDTESLKKQVKHVEEKYSQLQIHYLTVNEMKTKYESMLNQEQNKLKDVRTFNNNILKEKEEIIKKELEKNIQIASLQNQITQLRHSLTQEENIKSKFKSDYEEAKEHNKRITHQIKELQSSISFEKNKYNEIRDKLRQKDQQLNETRQETLLLKKKIDEAAFRHKGVIEQLKQENQAITKQLQSSVSQSNQTIRNLQGQLSKTTTQLQNAREEMGELEQSIFVERENNQSMQDSINKLKAELQDSKKKIEEMQQNYQQLLEQNREKDETMFEMGGKIYEYQGRMREMQEEKQRQIQQINHSLNVKYDEDYQEIYQKIEFIEKEKEYFKDKYQQKEQLISRKNQELKHKEIQEVELKKAFEQKIKKLQDQKLSIFTDKNKEVAKILQENKAQFETLRLKQSQIRKIAHQLQISRTTIQKQQSKIKETLNDKSNQVKVYQSEIQNLRKRELTFKSYKDLIRTNQWNCERQVRKHIQNFIKKILQIGEKEVRNENVISLIKGLEEGLLTAITTISKD